MEFLRNQFLKDIKPNLHFLWASLLPTTLHAAPCTLGLRTLPTVQPAPAPCTLPTPLLHSLLFQSKH